MKCKCRGLRLLDGTDGSATNGDTSLLYEDGTGDPANYFNNNIKCLM